MVNNSISQPDILNFLTRIEEEVHCLDELLNAVKEENRRAEVYGQQNISELMEISAYQWQLEQVEMKLKAPSLIKISFMQEGEKVREPQTEEERIEAFLLRLIMRIIRNNGACS